MLPSLETMLRNAELSRGSPHGERCTSQLTLTRLPVMFTVTRVFFSLVPLWPESSHGPFTWLLLAQGNKLELENFTEYQWRMNKIQGVYEHDALPSAGFPILF